MLLTSLVFAAALCSDPTPLEPLDAAVTVYRRVHVVTADGDRVLDHAMVVVQDGRIADIGADGSIPVPEGARIIDGEDARWLIPGLVDMHVHLPPGDAVRGGASWRVLTLLLANGVTTARGLAGHLSHPQLRDAIRKGDVVGPTLYVAGPALHDGNCASAEAARAAVTKQRDAGFDLVKSHELTNPEVWSAVADVAHEVDLPVAGHVTMQVGLGRAIAAHQQIEHLDAFIAALVPDVEALEPFGQFPSPEALDAIDIDRLTPLAHRVAEQGVWNTPTLALFEFLSDPTTTVDALLARDETRYAAKAARDAWSQQWEQHRSMMATLPADYGKRFATLRRNITKALADAHAPLLAGSDSPQLFQVTGFALHAEIEALEAAGLRPLEALCCATSNPARYLTALPHAGSAGNVAADFGVVAPGARADLVLLRADPARSIANARAIDSVMLRGRLFDRTALDAMLAEVAKSVK